MRLVSECIRVMCLGGGHCLSVRVLLTPRCRPALATSQQLSGVQLDDRQWDSETSDTEHIIQYDISDNSCWQHPLTLTVLIVKCTEGRWWWVVNRIKFQILWLLASDTAWWRQETSDQCPGCSTLMYGGLQWSPGARHWSAGHIVTQVCSPETWAAPRCGLHQIRQITPHTKIQSHQICSASSQENCVATLQRRF